MKICTRCRLPKEEEEFNKRRASRDGLASRCKECNKQLLKEHYDNYPWFYREKNKRRRSWIRTYLLSKKLKCTKCDEYHPACLDFHHRENKEVNIGEMVNRLWSKENIDRELSKCIVLCANCHRKLHWEERHSPIVELANTSDFESEDSKFES